MSERLRVAPRLLDGREDDALALPPEAAHHLRVLRVPHGATVVLFDGEGRERDAVVERVTRDAVIVAWCGEAREGVRGDRARVTWLQGYPKGDKLDVIVRQATELGVDAVGAVYTTRSVPQARDGKMAGRVERWARIAEEAARQCGRADVPTVHAPATLDEALRGLPTNALRIVAWEQSTLPLVEAVGRRTEGPVVVLAGPEGGLGADEVARCEREGFVAVSLGPRVLRAETVAPALLGALAVLCGDLMPR